MSVQVEIIGEVDGVGNDGADHNEVDIDIPHIGFDFCLFAFDSSRVDAPCNWFGLGR